MASTLCQRPTNKTAEDALEVHIPYALALALVARREHALGRVAAVINFRAPDPRPFAGTRPPTDPG